MRPEAICYYNNLHFLGVEHINDTFEDEPLVPNLSTVFFGYEPQEKVSFCCVLSSYFQRNKDPLSYLHH